MQYDQEYGVSDTLHLGRRVLFFPTLESTNTHALFLANDPGNDGLVVLAGEQTAGRGQQGRTWSAPAGSSVLLSVLLFPPPALRQPALLTAWAAVSVCRLIRQVIGREATIKWPNDVLIQGRKVCGILIEQRSTGLDQLAAVTGIGLNVSQPASWFPGSGLTEGTSLAVFARQPPDCRQVFQKLMRCLDEEYQRLLQGDLATLEAAGRNIWVCWENELSSRASAKFTRACWPAFLSRDWTWPALEPRYVCNRNRFGIS